METQAGTSDTALPQYWSRGISGEGGEQLTYAIRGGFGQNLLIALGAACIIGAAWGSYTLLVGGGLTVAGVIFVLLVPGGALLFGLYCLNRALWERHEYLLGRLYFSSRRYSLFGDRKLDVPRQGIEAITQNYTPPKASSAHDPGTWVTFVTHRDPATGKTAGHALDGMHTPDEARWLGPLLATWAGVRLQRSFAEELEEADPDELPEL
jgi:hypothetical protein